MEVGNEFHVAIPCCRKAVTEGAPTEVSR